MPRVSLVLPMLLSFVAITGCGGSSSPKTPPLTRSELIARGDVICKRLQTNLSSTSIKDEEELIRFLPRVVAYQRQAFDELSHLTPPGDMAGDWKTILAGAKTLADISSKIAEAAKAKDTATYRALFAESSKVQQHVVTVAGRDGFKWCSVTV